MKTDNFNHAEKVLVLGAGQLGAAVLDALVPAVIERRARSRSSSRRRLG